MGESVCSWFPAGDSRGTQCSRLPCWSPHSSRPRDLNGTIRVSCEGCRIRLVFLPSLRSQGRFEDVDVRRLTVSSTVKPSLEGKPTSLRENVSSMEALASGSKFPPDHRHLDSSRNQTGKIRLTITPERDGRTRVNHTVQLDSRRCCFPP